MAWGYKRTYERVMQRNQKGRTIWQALHLRNPKAYGGDKNYYASVLIERVIIHLLENNEDSEVICFLVEHYKSLRPPHGQA